MKENLRAGRENQPPGNETELSLFETEFLFFSGRDPVFSREENRSAHDLKVGKKFCMYATDNMQKCSVNDFTFPPVKEGEGRRNFSPGTLRRREENLPG